MIPVVLTVGAMDPLGADGVLADIRTFAGLGVHGAAAVTLVGEPAEPVDHALVARQIATVLESVDLAAVKLGALGPAAAVEAVARALEGCGAPVVADPSLARREDAGADTAAVEAWRSLILPRAIVATPNMAEAALLTGTERATTLGQMRSQGKAMVAAGCRHAVVSGGHGSSPHSIDILVSHDRPALEMRGERLDRDGMRGLSATLASAVAAHMAHGLGPSEAIHSAKLFVSTALGAADSHGADDGPILPHQMYRMWRRRAKERDGQDGA